MKSRSTRTQKEIISAKYSNGLYDTRVRKFKNLTGLSGLACYLTGVVMYTSSKESQIEDIVNLFKSIFTQKGYTEEDAMKYLNSNRNILLSNADTILRKLALFDSIGISNDIMFEHPEYLHENYSVVQAEKTYDLFSTLFVKNGYTQEEVNDYLKVNQKLLLSSRDAILKKLAVLDIIGLSNNVLFERPEYLLDDCSIDLIYDAVKTLQDKPYEITCTDLATMMYLNSDKKDDQINKPTEKKLDFISKMYERKLISKKEMVKSKERQ